MGGVNTEIAEAGIRMVSYEEYTDEELIEMLRGGDSGVMDYIMEKYKSLVRRKARALYLMGGDKDDLIQEGMVGLFKAIRDYRKDRDVSFYHFAQLCVTRQLYHAIEASNRKKHTPLNSYVSLYSGTLKTGDQTVRLENILYARESNPEELLIHEESRRQMEDKLNASLSPFEKKVLAHYMDGKDYGEIGELLNKPPKAIDNALQRIRKKIRVKHF